MGMQYRFTNNMLQQGYDDNATIKACRLPSALVEVPRINERYETQSLLLGDQLSGKNLKTVQLVENKQKDPILNINSAFFGNSVEPLIGGTSIPADPYEEIYKK
jgi:hypothetical protein